MSKERILFRVAKGALEPADGYSAMLLRNRSYKVGDIVLAGLSKPRNPKYHRLAHALGRMLAENIDDFTGLDAHAVLKRIQYEADIECERMEAKLAGIGKVDVRIPKSLSFASMGQEQFEAVYMAICRYVAQTYWHGMTDEQIAEMAEVMPSE